MLKNLKQLEEAPLVIAIPLSVMAIMLFKEHLIAELTQQGTSLLAVFIVWVLMVQPVANTQILHRNLRKEKIKYLLNKYDLRAMFQRNLRCLQTITWLGIAVIALAALGLGTGAFWPGIPFALYALTLLAIIGNFTFEALTNYEKFRKMTPEDRQILHLGRLCFQKG